MFVEGKEEMSHPFMLSLKSHNIFKFVTMQKIYLGFWFYVSTQILEMWASPEIRSFEILNCGFIVYLLKTFSNRGRDSPICFQTVLRICINCIWQKEVFIEQPFSVFHF